MFASDINFNRLPDVCKFDGNECQTDIFFQKRRGRTRCHDPDFFVVNVNIVFVAGDSFINHLKTDELAFQAVFL